LAVAVTSPAATSRIEILTQLFSDQGMSEKMAQALSCQLVLHHPITRKLGPRTLAREIEARGLSQKAAREMSVLLLAVELMDRGIRYQRILKHLGQLEVPEQEALAGALEASRIHRESGSVEDDANHWMGYAVGGVTLISAVMISLAILLELTK
jgi:hypothetical protein